MLQENAFPDIHEEIVEVMTYFRNLTQKSQLTAYPSGRTRRAMELTDTWLETQKEKAMAIVMPQFYQLPDPITAL